MEFLKKQKIDDRYYFKQDGSINNGFEVVTHPFTIVYAHHHLKFQKIIKWLEKRNFMSYETGACGLHIHLDRDFFNELDITKLRLFFSANREHLYKFSKREGKNDSFCEYENQNH